jgi:hypothetical protein
MFAEFLNQYGVTLLYMIVTAIGGYLGLVARNLVNKYLTDRTKRDIAKTVVQAVEQIYKDLHGEEKLTRALSAAAEMLTEKGIKASDLELRMLIEATVAEFNDAFHQTAEE